MNKTIIGVSGLFVLSLSWTACGQVQIETTDLEAETKMIRMHERLVSSCNKAKQNKRADSEKICAIAQSIKDRIDGKQLPRSDVHQKAMSVEQLKNIFTDNDAALKQRYPQGASGITSAFNSKDMQSLGCSLQVHSLAGIEYEKGGLNGVSSLYACHKSALFIHEADYSKPTKQKAVIYNAEFSEASKEDKLYIKSNTLNTNNGSIQFFTWMHPSYTIDVEVHKQTGSNFDAEPFQEIMEKIIMPIIEE